MSSYNPSNSYQAVSESKMPAMIEDGLDDLISKTTSQAEMPDSFRDAIAYEMKEGIDDILYSSTEEKPYSLDEAREFFDKEYFPNLLKETKGNQSKAADVAGINRKTIERKLKQYGDSDPRFNIAIYDITKQDPMEEPRYREVFSEVKEQGSVVIEAEQIKYTLADKLASYRDSGWLPSQAYDSISNSLDEYAPKMAAQATMLASQMTRRSRMEKQFKQAIETTKSYKPAAATFEKLFIYDTLKETKFDKKKAAEYLGISIKQLNRKIKEHDIKKEEKKITIDAKIDPKESEVDRLRKLYENFKLNQKVKNDNKVKHKTLEAIAQ